MDNFLKKIKKYFQALTSLKLLPENTSGQARKVIIGVVFCIGIIFLLTSQYIPVAGDFQRGEISSITIRAPYSMEIEDIEETKVRKELAAEGVSPVYSENREAYTEVQNKLNNFFDTIKTGNHEDAGELLSVLDEMGYNFNLEEAEGLMEYDDSEISRLEEVAFDNLRFIFDGPVRSDELGQILNELEERLIDFDISGFDREVLLTVFSSDLEPNLTLDEEATTEARASRAEQVEPVMETISAGEIIINQGEEFTQEELNILAEYELTKTDLNWLKITGTAFYFLIITLVIVFYLKKYHPKIWYDNKKLNLIQILLLLLFIIARVISIFDIDIIYYLTPVAMVPILLAVLLNSSIAVVVTLYITLLLPLIFAGQFSIAVLAFIGSMIGIFSVENLKQRNDLVRAGFYVSGVMIVTLVMFTFIEPAYSAVDTLSLMVVGLLNGILVAIFANGFLPYLESIFDLTSSVKLLELSNPSQPLLKRLLVEAPGTYHHSVLIGNLAETAADNIGADSLLARVGAYYHDIGKLSRPYLFSENQFGGDNPHNNIKPNLSALIIKSHVKDGVELGKEYKLPSTIIDIIEQHHGTNLISYFYQEALKENDDSNINEADFSYDGPKPRSKEAAIIMLADICEAAIRSKQYSKPNHKRIEVLIRGLIREKLVEEQLNESELTLKDLNVIAESFTRILTGIYHQRIDYPENLEEEMGVASNGTKK
ncbi:MAG: HD family phosphohydrolase [Bacillota bacterium]